MSTGVSHISPQSPGDLLSSISREVTQERVEAYAEAARDFNPIHLDEQFAAGTQFGRRIAHGMLILAFVSEMLAADFPDTWHTGGRLKVRFKNPVFAGETVTTFGEITAVRDSPAGPVAECTVGCRRPDGFEAVSGQAFVPLGRADGGPSR
ncbi:MAG: MaoC family dehydratase [Dehalococcoidia bacterium]